MKIFSAYDPPPSKPLVCGRGRTRQSDAESCDVNVIVRRYHKTGVLPVANREVFFADVSQLGDYFTVLNHVREAEKGFMRLPAAVRTRFGNDAAAFLDFCGNPENRGELVEMGLIEDVGAVSNVPDDSQNATPVAEGS